MRGKPGTVSNCGYIVIRFAHARPSTDRLGLSYILLYTARYWDRRSCTGALKLGIDDER